MSKITAKSLMARSPSSYRGCSGDVIHQMAILDYVPSIFNHLLSPLKRKHAREMERYERLSLAKTRKNAEVDKQTAAVALLALSEDGNGTL